jgi:hypothetical protein
MEKRTNFCKSITILCHQVSLSFGVQESGYESRDGRGRSAHVIELDL